MISFWKEDARNNIRGKIGILFVINLILTIPQLFNSGSISIDPSILEMLPTEVRMFVSTYMIWMSLISAVITLFLGGAFLLSRHYVYLNLADEENIRISDSFYGFKDYWASFKLNFLTSLYITLWSMLLIVPGIIAAYSYSMAPYILAENPGMSANECLKRSKEMTRGHKIDLFLLDLSFIGWFILCVLTLGILSIWITPYYYAAHANAYLDISTELGEDNIE